tara:strand:- start:609 stop:836 length:228 start_codon:yes stop_codon:yes gene_type:complete
LFIYEVGDLVVLQETVEWDDLRGVKGEICMVCKVYHPEIKEDEGVFFDYQICTADGQMVDVWCGEIKKLKDDKEI